jgi:hypothetical protein
MSLMDMIEQAAGGGALQQIGQRVGMSPDQLRSVVGSLAPMLGPKLAEHAATGGLAATPTGDAAPLPGSAEAEEHGRTVLGSILGLKDASRSAAADASADTGIDVDKIKSLLPQLASVAAVALASREGGSAGGVGGPLGSLLGGS